MVTLICLRWNFLVSVHTMRYSMGTYFSTSFLTSATFVGFTGRSLLLFRLSWKGWCRSFLLEIKLHPLFIVPTILHPNLRCASLWILKNSSLLHAQGPFSRSDALLQWRRKARCVILDHVLRDRGNMEWISSPRTPHDIMPLLWCIHPLVPFFLGLSATKIPIIGQKLMATHREVMLD